MAIVTTKIPAGEFKAKCLALPDKVRDLVVTKHDVAVTRILPTEPLSLSSGGRMADTVEIHGHLFSTGEKWEAWDA